MTDTNNSNWNSSQLTHGWQKGVTAFYYAIGLDESDFDKPQIGIGVPLLEGNTCNVHAYELAKEIQSGCQNAGLLAFPFGTPGVSDNLSQGHEGGNASLPSRNLIANSADSMPHKASPRSATRVDADSSAAAITATWPPNCLTKNASSISGEKLPRNSTAASQPAACI